MEIAEYLRILRNRWLVIVTSLAVVALAALAYSLLVTPKYESTLRLFVATASPASSNVTDIYQGNLASQQRVASYTELLTGKVLAQRTIDALGLSMTRAELASEVTASATPDTVIIDVAVTDDSAQRASDIANALGDQFMQFVRELETPQGGTEALGSVTVVEPAEASSSPVSPKTVRNVVLGAIVGLVLGIALAIIRSRLDSTIKGRSALETLSESPVVGSIPYDKDLNKSAAIDFATTASGSAEAFRELRTNLQFLEVDNPPRVLVITSAVPGEGKSTAAINVSTVLAEAGSRVVLVEGDLRRPRVSRYLGLEPAVGFSTVLVGRASVDDVLQRTRFPRVSVLASGPLPPNPSELLGSDIARAVIDQLRVAFDYVVIDAPPLLPVTDATVLAAHSDGALVVVRHGRTKRREFTRAVGNLQKVGANVLGVVLTMAPVRGLRDEEYRHYYETDTSLPQQYNWNAGVRPEGETRGSHRRHETDDRVKNTSDVSQS